MNSFSRQAINIFFKISLFFYSNNREIQLLKTKIYQNTSLLINISTYLEVFSKGLIILFRKLTRTKPICL